MNERTRRALKAYRPPLLMVLGGFVLAEILLRLAIGLHVQALATWASRLSLVGLIAGTLWMLWVSWRVWRRRSLPEPPGDGPA